MPRNIYPYLKNFLILMEKNLIFAIVRRILLLEEPMLACKVAYIN